MDAAEVLIDGYGRVHDGLHDSLTDLPAEWLERRVDVEANTIAWLAWHLVRVHDDHVATVARTTQRWTADGWHERFALPFDPSAIGYGQSSDDVAAVTGIGSELLLGYHDAVHEATVAFLSKLTPGDLDRVVDTRWDPPVTLGVRLVSVLADMLQHLGQVDYLRGLFRRADRLG